MHHFRQGMDQKETGFRHRNIRVFFPTNLPRRDAVVPAERQVEPLESGCLHDVAYIISNYECV